MRKLKIITDSSSSIISLDSVDFASAPMKIITDEREFVDNEALNVPEMVEYLEHYKGKSKSSCPNISDWLTAFGDADDIICITITSGLSGSFNAANSAKRMYEEQNAGKRVFVLDSFSAGPELILLVEKLTEYINAGIEFEQMCADITKYKESTNIFFMLKSVKNFANNGRISPLLAKIIGLMGICIVATASKEGTIEPTEKCRGEKRALIKIAECLKESGLNSGKVRISHCLNEIGANNLKAMLEKEFPNVQIEISECRGLCSFYAEKGGILVGYEKF